MRGRREHPIRVGPARLSVDLQLGREMLEQRVWVAWLMLGDKYELPVTTPSFSGLHVFTWMITAPSSGSAS